MKQLTKSSKLAHREMKILQANYLTGLPGVPSGFWKNKNFRMKKNMKRQLLFALALLACTIVRAQNVYGDMESWRNVYPSFGPPAGLESPMGWYDTDSLIFMAKYFFPNAVFAKQTYKTTDAHNGNYAAKVITRYQDTFGVVTGLLSNALPLADSQFADPAALVGGTHFYWGTAVNQRIDFLSAWIKYFPKGNDTALISIKAIMSGQAMNGNDSLIGSGVLMIDQTYTNYTSVSVPVNYINNQVPDKIYIFFTSSHKAPQDSSTLYIDDVSVSSTTGIGNLEKAILDAEVYPNPCTGVVYIKADKNQLLQLEICNALGQTVCKRSINGMLSMDMSSYPAGIYFYSIADEKSKASRKGKFNIIK